MTEQAIDFKKLYALLESLTPLPVDCGQLCQAKCCTMWQEGIGVYLLPKEREFFKDEPWAYIKELDEEEKIFNDLDTGLLICQGKCKRNKRPLFCRIFPLAAILRENGEVEIILDKDGIFICPLVQTGDITLLQKKFIEDVRLVWNELIKVESVYNYLKNYTKRINSQEKDPWLKLFK